MKRVPYRLLAYSLALAMTLPAARVSVYAEETETVQEETIVLESVLEAETESESITEETDQENEIGIIAEFVPMSEGESKYILNIADKPSLEAFTSALPQTLTAILEDGRNTEVPVKWYCVGDEYETSNMYYYQFLPKWDETQYIYEGAVPYVMMLLTEDDAMSSAVTSNKNETIIYNFLKNEMNCNTATAVGILANIYCESSFRPTAGWTDVNGLTSYGICQWNGNRFTALKNYCSKNGYAYDSLEGQLNYLKYELNNGESNAWKKLQGIENSAQGAYTAGYNWARYFERCSSVYYDSRGVLARDTYWKEYCNAADIPVVPDTPVVTPTDSYEITYNANGGTGGPASQIKTVGKALTLTSEKPVGKSIEITFDANGGTCDTASKKLNAVFKCWNTKKDGTGFSYDPGASYTREAAATLYAQWEEMTLKELPAASREGYVFDGWYTKDGELITSNRTIMVSQTFYAKWTDEETYNAVIDFVAGLYKICLDREPDEGGLNDWTYKLRSKQITGVKAAYGFVFSPEFRNKNLCNEDFVKQMYRAFLGREHDAAGLKDWVGRLERGVTREEIFNGFALSQEFKGLCETYSIVQGTGVSIPEYGTVPAGNCSVCGKEDGVTGFVKRLYKVCLGRNADASGLKDWTNKLWSHTYSGRDVAYGFIFSPEFTGKNYSNAQYVEYLYEAFMGRASDAAGKKDWLNRMEQGWTRLQVFDGFVGSQEFDNICNSYGIVRGK